MAVLEWSSPWTSVFGSRSQVSRDEEPALFVLSKSLKEGYLVPGLVSAVLWCSLLILQCFTKDAFEAAEAFEGNRLTVLS